MAILQPIQKHIDALADETGFPAEAVNACVARPEQSVPLLLAVMQRAARGTALSDAEADQLFLGVHILAKLRETQAFLPLMRLLRRPIEEVEDLLGDSITASMPKVLASVYDGDAESLFDFIADPSQDDFLRDTVWRAAVFLVHEGQIERAIMRDFIIRFDEERLAPSRDMGWVGWLDAIALLGFEDLKPRVDAIWTDDRLPENVLEARHFEKDLAIGLTGRFDADTLRRTGIGKIDDIAQDLAWADWKGSPEPIVNPMRNVGRNDPCPCGSGKKAKKCCLASAP